MSTYDYLLLVLVCANTVALAVVLTVGMDVQKTLNAFVGKYRKRRESKPKVL